MILFLHLCLLYCSVFEIHGLLDPSDYFVGSKPAPRLKILRPENGAVMEVRDVTIEIGVEGYDIPSSFHESQICVALSSNAAFSEQCFEQSADLIFHAAGLALNTHYSLRVVLFERSKAIAVSVRSFRVAGISIPGVVEHSGHVSMTHDKGDTNNNNNDKDRNNYNDNDYNNNINNNNRANKGGSKVTAVATTEYTEVHEPVTIQTALQIAVHHHTSGADVEAEKIYRDILKESPTQPDALHLLGLVLYQRGKPEEAIPYIEEAIITTTTTTSGSNEYEGYRNSLGECLRALNRLPEAEEQFSRALELQPNYASARFNLGLTYQQGHNYPMAIDQYKLLLLTMNVGVDEHGNQLPTVEEDPLAAPALMLMEANIRMCDLLTVQADLDRPYGSYTSTSNSAYHQHLDMDMVEVQVDDHSDLIPSSSSGVPPHKLALECWLDAHRLYPGSPVISTELGILYGRMGQQDLALKLHKQATVAALKASTSTSTSTSTSDIDSKPSVTIDDSDDLDVDVNVDVNDSAGVSADAGSYANRSSNAVGVSALVNTAHTLELLGYSNRARIVFQDAEKRATALGLPSLHIALRAATVLPRVLPVNSTNNENIDIGNSDSRQDREAFQQLQILNYISQVRHEMLASLQSLSSLVRSDSHKYSNEVTNTPPLHHGFSTGFHLCSHGLHYDNRFLKQHLHKVYTAYCPALGMARFVDVHEVEATSAKGNMITKTGNGKTEEIFYDNSKIQELTTDGKKDPFWNKDNPHGGTSQHSGDEEGARSFIRVGLASRFLRSHAVGLLVQELFPLLSSLNVEHRGQDLGVKTLAIFIDDGSVNWGRRIPSEETSTDVDWCSNINNYQDHNDKNLDNDNIADKVNCCSYGHLSKECVSSSIVTNYIVSATHEAIVVPADLTLLGRHIRSLDLDILMYPEVGIDPIVYFASFASLAPVQVAMLGHADTTGIPSIHHYISSGVEAGGLVGATGRYTERPRLMYGLGSPFRDIYSNYYRYLHGNMVRDSNNVNSDRVLEVRSIFMQRLGITNPRVAHLYLVHQPLYVLHPLFDMAIDRLLAMDPVGYIVMIDASNATAYRDLLRQRWRRTLIQTTNDTNSDIKSIDSIISQRIRFYTPQKVNRYEKEKSTKQQEEVSVLQAVASAHVVLDTFPTGEYLGAFQALSLGVPVVSLAGSSMRSRTTLALYDMCNYTDLVVDSHVMKMKTNSNINTKVLNTKNAKSRSRSVTSTDKSSENQKSLNLMREALSIYVKLALSIATIPKTRAAAVKRIHAGRHGLWETEALKKDWTAFLGDVTASLDRMQSKK